MTTTGIRLHAPAPGWSIDADVVVVGSGVAGLTAALRCEAAGLTTVVVTKARLDDGSTRWAQGGIAAALGEGDTPSSTSTTPWSPARACATRRRCASWSPRAPTPYGGSSRRARSSTRPPTAAWNSPARAATTGAASPTRAATPRARRSPAPWSRRSARGAAHDRERARARPAHRRRGPHRRRHPARHGRGPARRRGRGARARRGARHRRHGPGVLRDHQPGRLHRRRRRPRAARGRRGERPGVRPVPPHGAVPRPGRGGPAAAGLRGGPRRGRPPGRRRRRALHAGAARAGRAGAQDIVAKGIVRRMLDNDAEHMYLDARHFGAEMWEQRFPTILAACRAHGIDPVTQPVPVAPAAHYASGGVRTDSTAAPRCPACTRAGRSPAPECTAPTGSRPTRSSKASSTPSASPPTSPPPASTRACRSRCPRRSAPRTRSSRPRRASPSSGS